MTHVLNKEQRKQERKINALKKVRNAINWFYSPRTVSSFTLNIFICSISVAATVNFMMDHFGLLRYTIKSTVAATGMD